MTENPILQKAIAAFCDEPSVETERQLAAALAEASFFLPVRRVTEGEDGGLQVDVSTLHSPEGGRFLFGFTGQNALAQWSKRPPDEVTTVPLRFPEIAELTLRSGTAYDGFAIDPGGPGQHILSARTIAAYSGSAMPVTLAEQSELVLGAPNEFPAEMGKAMCAAAATLAGVRRLWLLLKLERSSGERSFLVLVDNTGGDMRTICDAIGRAASAHLPTGLAVELLPVASELGRTALEQHPKLRPFYARN